MVELRPNQNHRVSVFAFLSMEGVEHECRSLVGSLLVISATGPGRATQAEPQADTGRNGGVGGMQKFVSL